MAFTVRVIGPEFASEENRRAFLRIEESARQYSAHSRESIYLVRRPLKISEDHFVLLWPRGITIVGMYPYGGTIRSREHDGWEAEPLPGLSTSHRGSSRSASTRARSERSVELFANPYITLEAARKEFTSILRMSEAEGMALEVDALGDSVSKGNATRNAPAGNSSELSSAVMEDHITLLALLTGHAPQMRIVPLVQPLFSAMTIDEAVARSIVHIPNILRAADIPAVFNTNADMERISDLLARAAHVQDSIRKSLPAREILSADSPSHLPLRRRLFTRRSQWLVPLVIVLAIVAFYVFRSMLRTTPSVPIPAPAPPSRAASEIVIEMPVEVELFISPTLFPTREQLDFALAHGDGQRYLPDKQQVLVMDSVSLAKGVYGYFKVDNTWRKGKLLETLQPVDTVTIIKFLDPLP